MIYFGETEIETVRLLLAILEMIKLHLKYFSEEIENIFFEILLPKTKPIMVGIIYISPSQNNFLEILNKNFPSFDTDAKETYILGDFNINKYQNNKYIVHENNTVCTKFTFADAKKYHQFCTMNG